MLRTSERKFKGLNLVSLHCFATVFSKRLPVFGVFEKDKHCILLPYTSFIPLLYWVEVAVVCVFCEDLLNYGKNWRSFLKICFELRFTWKKNVFLCWKRPAQWQLSAFVIPKFIPARADNSADFCSLRNSKQRSGSALRLGFGSALDPCGYFSPWKG